MTSSDSYGATLSCAGRNSIGRQLQPCTFTLMQASKIGYWCQYSILTNTYLVAKIFALQRKVSLLVAQPSAPENCTIFRGPKGYAEVQCTANYNGGVRQTYYLEVYDNAKTVMYGNYTNSKRPHFVLRNLGGDSMAAYPTDTHYRLEAFATNRKGPSNKAIFPNVDLTSILRRKPSYNAPSYGGDKDESGSSDDETAARYLPSR